MQLCRKKQIIHRPASQQAGQHAKNMPSASEYFQQSTYLNPRTIMTAIQKKLEDNSSQQLRSDKHLLQRNLSATSNAFMSTNQATYQRKDFGIAKPNLDFLKPSAQQQKQWNYPPDILASQYTVDYKNKMKQQEKPKESNGLNYNQQLRKARSVKFIDEVEQAKEREAEIKQQKLKTFSQASQYQYDYIHRKQILKQLDYSSDEENEKHKQKLKPTNENKSSTGILLNPFKPVPQTKQRINQNHK